MRSWALSLERAAGRPGVPQPAPAAAAVPGTSDHQPRRPGGTAHLTGHESYGGKQDGVAVRGSWFCGSHGRHGIQRWRAARAALTVIALCIAASACTPRAPAPTTSEASSSEVSKQTFILRLIGFCAGVNQRLATPGKNNESQAGRTAQELEGMVHQVLLSQVPPDDRQQFDTMMSALLDAASKQRAVAVAETSKQQGTIDSATKQATDALNTADAAAVAYGMHTSRTRQEAVRGRRTWCGRDLAAGSECSDWRAAGGHGRFGRTDLAVRRADGRKGQREGHGV